MTHIPDQLTDEFPGEAARIHELKLSNSHFLWLCERYDGANTHIHHVESDKEAMEDLALESLKKHRLLYKDEIARILKAA